MCALTAVFFAQAHQITLPTSLVASGDTVQTVRAGLAFTEGPAVDTLGNLFFTEPFDNEIWKIPPTGGGGVFRSNSNRANGLVFDSRDRLIACERGQLTRTETDSTVDTLVTLTGTGDLDANDLSLASDGGIFFTQPVWGGEGNVYHLSSAGTLKTLLPSVTGFPNGIEYIEEKDLLYIAYSQRNAVWRYTVGPQNDLLDSAEFIITSSPDGFAVDAQGNLWIVNNSQSRVTVFDSAGQTLGQIQLESIASAQNCAFGGPQNRVFYIAAATAVFSVRTVVAGRSTRGDVPVGSRPQKKSPADVGAVGRLVHARVSAGTVAFTLAVPSVSAPDRMCLEVVGLGGALLARPALTRRGDVCFAVWHPATPSASGLFVWRLRDGPVVRTGAFSLP
jgi:gluconolactonase